ncbi:MAG: hypothetical protein V1685_02195, partial [Parcubacteria group bacterium]
MDRADTSAVDNSIGTDHSDSTRGDQMAGAFPDTAEVPIGTKESRNSAIQKIKRATKRLVLWGMIYGSALTALDSPSKKPQEQQPPEKQSLS